MLKSKTLILAALILTNGNIFTGDDSGEGRPFSPEGRRPSATYERHTASASPAADHTLGRSTSPVALGARPRITKDGVIAVQAALDKTRHQDRLNYK